MFVPGAWSLTRTVKRLIDGCNTPVRTIERLQPHLYTICCWSCASDACAILDTCCTCRYDGAPSLTGPTKRRRCIYPDGQSGDGL